MKTISVVVCGQNVTCDTCAEDYTVAAVVGRLDGPSAAEMPMVCGLDDATLLEAVHPLLVHANHPVADAIKYRLVDGGIQMTNGCPHCDSAYTETFDATTVPDKALDPVPPVPSSTVLSVLVRGSLHYAALNNANNVLAVTPRPGLADEDDSARPWNLIPLADRDTVHIDDLDESPARLWLNAYETGDLREQDLLARWPWRLHRPLRRLPQYATCLAGFAAESGLDLAEAAHLLVQLERDDSLLWIGQCNVYTTNPARWDDDWQTNKILAELGQTPNTTPLPPRIVWLHPRQNCELHMVVDGIGIPEPSKHRVLALEQATTDDANSALEEEGWETVDGWTSYTSNAGVVGLYEAWVTYEAASLGFVPEFGSADSLWFVHAEQRDWPIPYELTDRGDEQ
jgi:hypothetical protein